jgi:hypothetical protein
MGFVAIQLTQNSYGTTKNQTDFIKVLTLKRNLITKVMRVMRTDITITPPCTAHIHLKE